MAKPHFEEIFNCNFEIIRNGYSTALKFNNGILICFGKSSFSANFPSDNSRCTLNEKFEFPYEFNSTPSVSVNTLNDTDYKYCSVVGIIRDTSRISAITLFCDKSGTGIGGISYIAIGTWK